MHATVCDSNFANQKTALELGCSLAENGLKTEFHHPSVEGHTIFFLFDACHLLKNMRNCLGEYGVLFDSDGLPVKWWHRVKKEIIRLDKSLHFCYLDLDLQVQAFLTLLSCLWSFLLSGQPARWLGLHKRRHSFPCTQYLI